MVLPTSGALSLGQIATEYSDSQPNSMSEFYRGGSLVPTTVSGSATQAAPSTNGTYNDFGGVTGLTLVRATGTISGRQNYGNVYGTEVRGSSSQTSILYNVGGGNFDGTLTVTSGSGNVRTFTNGSQIGLSQPGPWTAVRNGEDNASLFIDYTQSTLTYTFTNNTGFDATIEGTTVANGASSAINPSGDYNISFTVNSNANVPTSGTIDFADFYGGRAS